jgi:hypothetical protein
VTAVVLTLALVVHFGAHVAIATAFVRRAEYVKAAAGFLVPPLAVYWGWQAERRMEVGLWAGALFVYALGVALVG